MASVSRLLKVYTSIRYGSIETGQSESCSGTGGGTGSGYGTELVRVLRFLLNLGQEALGVVWEVGFIGMVVKTQISSKGCMCIWGGGR